MALGVAALTALASCGGGYNGGNGGGNGGGNAPPPRLAQSHSTPLALTSDNAFVWSVNPDNDSVSVFEVAGDRNLKLTEVPVGASRVAWRSRPTTRRSTSPTRSAAPSRWSTPRSAR